MKKFVNILLGCFFFLGVSKGTAADLDEVICNAMKGMQVKEEKKIPYNIGDYRLMGISVDCKKKALITEKNTLSWLYLTLGMTLRLSQCAIGRMLIVRI